MRISTRIRYGLRMMLKLALNYGKGPILLKEIALREEISEKYLSQLIIPLKGFGLINSSRGARGGYTLAKPPQEITLKEIVAALEGDLTLVACVKEPSLCNRVSICVTRDVWDKLGSKISEFLCSLTLDDLLKMHREKEKSVTMYNI